MPILMHQVVVHDGNTDMVIRITNQQANTTVDGQSVTATMDKPGEVTHYTFTGSAGQHIFVDIPSNTLRSQCESVQLLDPSGNQVNNGCIINGSGNIDEKDIVLPVTGTYTIVLDPGGTVTGIQLLNYVITSAGCY